jgi:hypothetical protein
MEVTMAYRNATYVAFHAEGTSDPTETDMKYYRLLTAWHEHEDIDFGMINSHDKTSSVRDTSKRTTLMASLKERLRNSKNMILIVGKTTRMDRDWVPFEIAYAIDECAIPVIVAYPNAGDALLDPFQFRPWWPDALASRIDNQTARTVHVPFRKQPLKAAISKYSHNEMPGWPITVYKRETYQNWGLLAT